MDKIIIIAAHEFRESLKRKEFLFFTFIIPLALLAFAAIVPLIGNRLELYELMAIQAKNAFFAFPLAIAMVFSLAIFLSANFLLQGISSEKQNRIMEVLLSTVSFRQLFTGKIIGLGFIGLLQFFVWTAAGIIVFLMAMPPGPIGIGIDIFLFAKVFLFMAFFLLGYFLYAAIMAAIGALAETTLEAQQISSLLSVFSLLPAMDTFLIMQNGDIMYGTALSLFPLTAPIASIIRVFLGKITIFGIIASISVLLASTALTIVIASRLFRAETLMVGKRFSFTELIKFVIKK